MGITVKRLELEFMLAEQARVSRVAAGTEGKVEFRTFLDQFKEDNSLVDKPLLPKPPDFASAYSGCDYQN